MKQEDDTTKYKLKLLNIALYMPVAQLSQSVFSEINSILTRSVNNKPVGIHYRKIDVRPLTIPRNSQVFHSELLFTDDIPARLIVCFVESDAKAGSYTKNPFNFKRKWKVPKTANLETENAETQNLTRENLLEQRLKEIENLNRQLQENLQKLQSNLSQPQKTSKGKGRGKNRNCSPSTSSSITNNLQNVRLNDFGQAEHQSEYHDATSISSTQRALQSETTNVIGDDTKDLYIKKIELLINGNN